MNGAQLLKKALKDAGVKHLFGYTGGAIMPFFDQYEKGEDDSKIMVARHEQGAAYMAQGVARGSVHQENPQIAACISTSGPGAMNMVTGVADAIMDSVPLLAISGQVGASVIGTDAFQETDVVGVMLPITKQTYMPLKTEKVEETIHEAIHIAMNGRPGPVAIDIPKNVQIQEVDKTYGFNHENYEADLPGFKYGTTPDQKQIDEAVKMINNAKQPVIFCGHGVRIANAGAELVQFAEKVKAPIATTLHGNTAFDTTHELHLGWMGMHGAVEANRAIEHSDLIISFGMRFDDRVTGKLDEYAKNADVIHVEIDASEIDKNVKTSIGINADAKETLNAFINHSELKTQPREEWFKKIEEYKKEMGSWHQEELEKGTGAMGRILMKSIITKLSDITNGEDILVMDVGQNQMMGSKYYKFKNVNTCFNSGGAGTMGASLPMAVGVKLVRPDETVWSINGDGGFQMNIQELGAVMENDINIKIIILNNEYLGMVRQWQTLFFDGRYAGTPMVSPSYGKIAEAYGLPYQFVEKIEDVEGALTAAREHNGAYVLEFACDASEVVMPMIPTGKPFSEMIVNKP